MRLLTSIWVGTTGLLLAAALACDDDGAPPSSPQGPPPPDPADTVAPQTVSDLTMAYRPATDDVAFAWTAPRDDDATDRVARYDIRYAYSFPVDWDRSVAVTDPPDPAPVGTSQTYALTGVPRGRDIFAAARTFDAAGNASPVGPVTHLRIPGIRFEAVCEDVFLDAPVEGLDAILTAAQAWNLTTGPDGLLALDEVASGTLGIHIETGSAPIPYHPFERTLVLGDDVALSIPMIPFIPADAAAYASTLAILIDALVRDSSARILKRWSAYPIPWYAPEYTNAHGLDYTDLARQAAARWNTRTGMEIFVEVPAPPDAGVEMRFLPRSLMAGQNGITEHENDANGYPAGEVIKIVDDFSDGPKLYTILMHELGHTIRLGHLPAGFVMYAGQPLPPDITDDEARVVRMMLAIPNGTDFGFYDAAAVP
jgi:hypothetical protein